MSNLSQTQAPYAPAQQDPGRTLGTVGLVLAIVANVVGLIVSIVAYKQSKNAGFDNGLAKAGIIVGAITTGLAVIAVVINVIAVAAQLSTVN